ncbi:MAG: exo-alpha-sialidase [Acidimicrobiaceae bacterium]|nr:exo-alpha-sialidase [Acidimicrobiaceae bacterium]
MGVPILATVLVAGSQSANAVPPSSAFEVQITSNPAGFSSGEPEIAINPTNPNNLFIDHATFAVPPGGGMPPLTSPPPPHSCGGYVSMDRGVSWQPGFLPFTPQANPFAPNDPSQVVWPSQCEDGVAAFGPDGTLYAGGDTTIGEQVASLSPPCPPNSAATPETGGLCLKLPGDDPFARSTDGGKTWTQLPYPIGSQGYGLGTAFGGSDFRADFNFAPGSGHPVDTYDRPFLAVDQSNGTVYVSSQNILDHERFVTASTDKGDSWGPIYAVDSTTYPQSGFGSNIAVQHGVLAVSYTAAAAPGGCAATCLIFETSRDFGATWTRNVVPLVNAQTPPNAFLAADPAGPGHFALQVFDATGTVNQIYTTRDFGATWQGPTNVTEPGGHVHFKPWLSFGPSGQLALVWRTWEGTPNLSTTPYDVFVAVGRVERANGAVFTSPLELGSPAAPFGTGGGGDDFSQVQVDNNYVHVAWGDSRSGLTQVEYARIPLTAFVGNNNS